MAMLRLLCYGYATSTLRLLSNYAMVTPWLRYGYALATLWLRSGSAERWLNQRTHFTRSLATMSMVGYLLGLGDRHLSNLMLEQLSGRVLHIDFGDCFEVAIHHAPPSQSHPRVHRTASLDGRWPFIARSSPRRCPSD